MPIRNNTIGDRQILLGPSLAGIPERLLLAHSRGEVLFIAGAGVSQPALPNFRGLVLKVYERLDPAVFNILSGIPTTAHNQWPADLSGLNDPQAAEVKRFVNRDYDIVLGMLERRMDSHTHSKSCMREAVATELRLAGARPAPIHRALMRLADRGGAITVVTTNFDLLLEDAAKSSRLAVKTYALDEIPRPGHGGEFAGVLHIHGALNRNPKMVSDLVLTDQDFGEFYLRRRIVSDFIYDAARLYHLALIGYSANDPPMRYLLNAVAADGTRFRDLKERFAFIGTPGPDPVELEDWKGRGITPIRYDSRNDHVVLCRTLEKWASLSANDGRMGKVDAELKRIVGTDWKIAASEERDLFDYLVRRSNANERVRLSALISGHKASFGWLDAIVRAFAEQAERA